MSRKRAAFLSVVGIALIGVMITVVITAKRQNAKDLPVEEDPTEVEARQTIESITEGYKKRAEESENPQESIANTVGYAHMLASQGRLDEALQELLNAEKSFGKEDIEKTDLYFQISGIYELMERIDEASSYKKKYIELLRATGREEMAEYLENPPEDT